MAVEVGDLVWAKMKGYPAWPGRVVDPPLGTKPRKNQFYIFFFGSENYSWIIGKNVYPYAKNIEKFSAKNKSKFFRKAVDASLKEYASEEKDASSSETESGDSESDDDIIARTMPELKKRIPVVVCERCDSNEAANRREEELDNEDEEEEEKELDDSDKSSTEENSEVELGSEEEVLAKHPEITKRVLKVTCERYVPEEEDEAEAGDYTQEEEEEIYDSDQSNIEDNQALSDRTDSPKEDISSTPAPLSPTTESDKSDDEDAAEGPSTPKPISPSPASDESNDEDAAEGPSTPAPLSPTTESDESNDEVATKGPSTPEPLSPSPATDGEGATKGRPRSKKRRGMTDDKGNQSSSPKRFASEEMAGEKRTECNIIATNKQIGVLGLGPIGKHVVKNLLLMGHHVNLWTKEPELGDDLLVEGAVVYNTPAAVAAASDIVFLCVSDGDEANAIMYSDTGIYHGFEASLPKKGLVNMVCVRPEKSDEFSDIMSLKRGRYLEVQVVEGSQELAETGDMLLICSGDVSLYKDCMSCLFAMSRTKNPIYLSGQARDAPTMKLLYSGFTGSLYIGLQESLAALHEMGIDKGIYADILRRTVMNSKALVDGTRGLTPPIFSPVQVRQLKHSMGLLLVSANRIRQPVRVITAAHENLKARLWYERMAKSLRKRMDRA